LRRAVAWHLGYPPNSGDFYRDCIAWFANLNNRPQRTLDKLREFEGTGWTQS